VGVRDGTIGGALAVWVLAVYLRTLHPSIPGGDSGELIAVAASAGVAHPPGYPLFSMLGHALTWVPVGSVPYRVNLLSALCDAGAAVVLFAAVRRWCGSASAGFLAGGMFAFSPGIWSFATVAEVFALNNLLAAILLYLVVRFYQERQVRWAAWGAFVMGLGMANHHTLVFLALPVVVLAFSLEPKQLLRPRVILGLVACGLAGLLPYAYLPLAAWRVPAAAWGDAGSLSGFLDHVLRRHVGTFNLGDPRSDSNIPILIQLLLYFKDLFSETAGLGLLLAAYGAWKRWFTDGLMRWSLTTYCVYVCVFHALANLPLHIVLFQGVLARFWQMPSLLVFAWVGLGWNALLPRGGGRAAIVVATVVGLQMALNFSDQDQHDNYYVERYARWLVESLPRGSMLIRDGDLATFSTLALQTTMGVRPDVTLVDISALTYDWRKPWMAVRQPNVVVPGIRYGCGAGEPGTFDFQDFLDSNLPSGPVYYFSWVPETDRRYQEAYPSLTDSILNKVHHKGEALSNLAWINECRALLPEGPVPSFSKYPETTWENQVRLNYGVTRRTLAARVLDMAKRSGNDPKLARISIQLTEEVMKVFAGYPPDMYKSLWEAYEIVEKQDPKLHSKTLELKRLYRNSLKDQ
jgi:hypothetical protein